MSTTSNDPIPVRFPGRILTSDLWRDDRPPAADVRVQELTAYRLDRLEAEVLGRARSAGGPEQRLRRMITAYVTLAITDPGIMTLVSGSAGETADGSRGARVRLRVRRFTDALERYLEKTLGARDRSPSIDSGVAAQSLLGIIHWGVSSHRAEGRLSRDEAAAQITFLALHGLVAGPPARPARRRGLHAA